MLDEDGVFLLKESVKQEKSKKKGNDFYTSSTREDFELLFKNSGMYHIKVDELEFTYPGQSKPCEKEMYWALFKNKTRYEENMLLKDNK